MKRKNVYIVITFEEDGKYWAVAYKEPANASIKPLCDMKHACGALVFDTWKEAKAIAKFWNENYKKSGNYKW